MAGVGIRIDGYDATLADLGALAGRLSQPRPMWDAIGLSLVTSTRRRFEEGHGPDGNPWPPSLRVLAHGGKTLIERGRLMGSISFEASDTGVAVGSNVEYAAIHQLGGDIKQGAREQVLHFKRNSRTGRTRFAKPNAKATFAQKVTIGERTIHMPARPFLGVDDDDDDEREIIAIATDFVAGQERASGRAQSGASAGGAPQ